MLHLLLRLPPATQLACPVKVEMPVLPDATGTPRFDILLMRSADLDEFHQLAGEIFSTQNKAIGPT